MKKLFTTIVVALLAANAHSQTAGTLDSTFSMEGKQITPIGTHNDAAYVTVVQPDGKIIVAGSTSDGAAYNFALVRYNSDGSLDNTFGTGGKVNFDAGSDYDIIYGVALQSDGKIVAAGGVYNNDGNVAVARFLANGTIDMSFGTNGVTVTDFGTTGDAADAVAIQSDGKIVIAGLSFSSQSDVIVARYNTDGSLDNTFNGNGKVITDVAGSDDEGTSVAIQADGKIVVGGYANVSGAEQMVALRYLSNGSLDPAFGTNGQALTPFSNSDGRANAVVIQSDGKILLAGFARNATTSASDFALVRYNTDGTLDNTFDSDGKVTTDFGTVTDAANTMVLQPDGKIVVGGKTSAGAYTQFALARYLTNGSLDNTFNGTGKVATDMSGDMNFITALALQPDGKIVAAGIANNGTDDDFAVARYNSGLSSTYVFPVALSSLQVSVYPNPSFNKSFALIYTLPQNETVGIDIMSMNGRLIQTFDNAQRSAGLHRETITVGNNVSSGDYLLMLRTSQQTSCLHVVVQ